MSQSVYLLVYSPFFVPNLEDITEYSDRNSVPFAQKSNGNHKMIDCGYYISESREEMAEWVNNFELSY